MPDAIDFLESFYFISMKNDFSMNFRYPEIPLLTLLLDGYLIYSGSPLSN